MIPMNMTMIKKQFQFLRKVSLSSTISPTYALDFQIYDVYFLVIRREYAKRDARRHNNLYAYRQYGQKIGKQLRLIVWIFTSLSISAINLPNQSTHLSAVNIAVCNQQNPGPFGGCAGIWRLIKRHACSSSRRSASIMSRTLSCDHSFSAVALTRGKIRCKMFVSSTDSAHMHAVPPSKSFCWAAVPGKLLGSHA